MRPVRNANTEVPKIGRHSSLNADRRRGLSKATDDWSGSLIRMIATARIEAITAKTRAMLGITNVTAYRTSAAVWLPSTNRYAVRSGSAAHSLPHEMLMSASPTPRSVPAAMSSISVANEMSPKLAVEPSPGMARMPTMNSTAPTLPN